MEARAARARELTMSGSPVRSLRLAAVALLTTMLAVPVLPSLLAAGAAHPEITDPAGDANPAAFFVNSGSKSPVFENETAYDLVKVYVLLETSDHLYLRFESKDLPDRWATPAAPPPGPVGPNATQPAVVLVANFTVHGKVFEAQANLSQPSATGLRDSYALRVAGLLVPLSGAVNAYDNTVTVAVPKSLLGQPVVGDLLSQFRAEGRFGTVKLDFAPNAANVSTPSPTPGLLTIVLNKIAGQQVVEPQFGLDYRFTGGGGDGAIQLRAPTQTKSIPAGTSTSYLLYVKNLGSAGDTVYFTLPSAPAGFTHHLSVSQLNLAPGEEQTVVLTVTAGGSAQGALDSVVTAVSKLGGAASSTFRTRVTSDGSTSSTPSATDSSTDRDGAFHPARSSHRSGVPGFEGAWAAAGVLGAVLAMRRRR